MIIQTLILPIIYGGNMSAMKAERSNQKPFSYCSKVSKGFLSD